MDKELTNTLTNEINESKKKNLLFDLDENREVKLSKKNIALVMAMIRENSSYCNVFNEDTDVKLKKLKIAAVEKYEKIDENNVNDNSDYRDGFFGSSAYWFKQMRDNEESEKDDKIKVECYKYYLFKAICAVDNENSTHLNGDNVGRIQIWKRICAKAHTVVELKDCLITEDLCNPNMVKTIAKETSPTDSKKRPRRNISFASKFCHYACRNLLDEMYWDKFPIYDKILKEVIPYFASEYHVDYEKKDYNNENVLISYQEVVKIMNGLSVGTGFSKTGIDQLLWYYYKAHKIPKIK